MSTHEYRFAMIMMVARDTGLRGKKMVGNMKKRLACVVTALLVGALWVPFSTVARADLPDTYPVVWEDDHHVWSDGTEEWLTDDGWVTENPDGPVTGDDGEVKVQPIDEIEIDERKSGGIYTPEPDDEPVVVDTVDAPNSGIRVMHVLAIAVGALAIIATLLIVAMRRRRRDVTVKPAHLNKS